MCKIDSMVTSIPLPSLHLTAFLDFYVQSRILQQWAKRCSLSTQVWQKVKVLRYVGLMWSLFKQILIFEWYFAWLGDKQEHHKDPCHDEIGLFAQAIGTILGSIVNKIGRAYVITETKNENPSSDLRRMRAIWYRTKLLDSCMRYWCYKVVSLDWHPFRQHQIWLVYENWNIVVLDHYYGYLSVSHSKLVSTF
jgi:hypothetical protein